MGSYNFVHYHAFVNCIYFLYLVQIIDFFLLIELPTILSAVWRETKQIRKYQGDYLVKRKRKKKKNPNVGKYFNYNIKSAY
jgi:hypothetical protein